MNCSIFTRCSRSAGIFPCCWWIGGRVRFGSPKTRSLPSSTFTAASLRARMGRGSPTTGRRQSSGRRGFVRLSRIGCLRPGVYGLAAYRGLAFMSNLLASLRTSGNALAVFQDALGTIQNNIDNGSTPGYAKQQVNLEAQPFDMAGGLAGGVAARGLDDSRNQFAEEEVRRQVNTLGRLDVQSQAVSSIEKLFDVSGTTGLPAALTQLFSSFSAWSVDPNGISARQTVLDSAGQFADQVRNLAGSLNNVSQSLDQQIASTVQQVNSLAAQV